MPQKKKSAPSQAPRLAAIAQAVHEALRARHDAEADLEAPIIPSWDQLNPVLRGGLISDVNLILMGEPPEGTAQLAIDVARAMNESFERGEV